jgi:hypothetical protein
VPDGTYDAIVIDAFSSDSIPLHLLTREAVALYHRKLGPDGAILFHVSNRYLELAPLVAALARDSRSAARQLRLDPPAGAMVGQFAAEVVAVSKPGRQLSYLTEAAGWRTPEAAAEPVWTDVRSDLLSRIRWR